MNSIETIEIKEIKESINLAYSIKFILNMNSKPVPIFINNSFKNDDIRNRVIKNLENWQDYFLSWTYVKDDRISNDFDRPIKDYHLVTPEGKNISLYDVVDYLKEIS